MKKKKMTAAQAAGSALGKRSWKARKATIPPDFFKKLRAMGVEKQKKKKAAEGYTEDVV
jgi:hypothetical protein